MSPVYSAILRPLPERLRATNCRTYGRAVLLSHVAFCAISVLNSLYRANATSTTPQPSTDQPPTNPQRPTKQPPCNLRTLPQINHPRCTSTRHRLFAANFVGSRHPTAPPTPPPPPARPAFTAFPPCRDNRSILSHAIIMIIETHPTKRRKQNSRASPTHHPIMLGLLASLSRSSPRLRASSSCAPLARVLVLWK